MVSTLSIKPAWALDLTSFWDLQKKKGGITTKEQLHNEKLVLAKYRIKFQHHNLSTFRVLKGGESTIALISKIITLKNVIK